MKVEFLNQFTQTFEVDGHITVEVFRTHKTLEKLIEALDSDGRVTDGDWNYDGVVACVYGIIADSNGDINRVREFNKKKNYVKFGDKGYHTLNEVLDADLAWIREYGIVEDKEDFKKKFEDAAQKKVASPLTSVLTSSEAEKKWGLKDSTVRSACSRGKLKKYIGTGVKQTDKTWLVMDWVMEKEYGENN